MHPIERAARAMYDNIAPEWDWDDPDAELLRQMYRENARAAIAAIRDADPAWLVDATHHAHDEGRETSRRVWRAMVDALLAVE